MYATVDNDPLDVVGIASCWHFPSYVPVDSTNVHLGCRSQQVIFHAVLVILPALLQWHAQRQYIW